MRRLSVLVLAVLLTGCATSGTTVRSPHADCAPDTAAPVLRLSPASLGRELVVQQQLAVTV